MKFPEEYGGAGGTFFEAVLAVEAISSVDPAVGVLVDVQNTLCINALARWATADQKARYLSRLAKDTVGAYCLSEAASGSDAFALQTRATRRESLNGTEYVLNGQKLWITNAKEAGLFLVFATLDPSLGYKGITAFVVEKGNSGIYRRQEGRQAGYSGLEHLRVGLLRLRRPPRAGGGRARQGLQDRH